MNAQPRSDPRPPRAPWPLLLSLLCLFAAGAAFAAPPDLRDGDLIFHVSRSSQSAAIQRATGSRYSHMGMVFLVDGRPQVFEASATVRYTPLAQWIARGERGHYVVKRLRDEVRTLSPADARALRREAGVFAGRPYDLTFEWSDRRIYCSELAWKLYRRALGIEIGERERLRDFRLDDPLVKAKLRERYGAHVPLDEPVISPAAMFDSPKLRTVVQR